jgi:cell wall-associated NlpC family hydrolase
MDCSGLIQTARLGAGRFCPRDADMQEAQIGAALDAHEAWEGRLRRGDLVCWKGHIGVMVDSCHLLHANAYHMETALEPLADAAARIAASPAGPIRSIKREA